MSILNRYGKFLEKRLNITLDFGIQLGDFGAFRDVPDWKGIRTLKPPTRGGFRFRSELYVTPGNHEDPKEIEWARQNRDKLRSTNLVVTNQGEIITRVIGEESITMMFVGGAPCQDTPPVFMPFDAKDFTKAIDSWREAGCPKVDLLITHEAPTGTGRIGLPMYGNPMDCGVRELRTLWETIHPKYQINGHYHINHYYEEGELRHKILPVAQYSMTVLDTNADGEGGWGFTEITASHLYRF